MKLEEFLAKKNYVTLIAEEPSVMDDLINTVDMKLWRVGNTYWNGHNIMQVLVRKKELTLKDM